MLQQTNCYLFRQVPSNWQISHLVISPNIEFPWAFCCRNMVPKWEWLAYEWVQIFQLFNRYYLICANKTVDDKQKCVVQIARQHWLISSQGNMIPTLISIRCGITKSGKKKWKQLWMWRSLGSALTRPSSGLIKPHNWLYIPAQAFSIEIFVIAVVSWQNLVLNSFLESACSGSNHCVQGLGKNGGVSGDPNLETKPAI